MRLAEKRKTINYLEKLRRTNFKSAYIYKVAHDHEKRLMLKNFYLRLFEQKKMFIEQMEHLIDQLKKEISPLPDSELLNFYQRKKCQVSHLYLHYKMRLNYTDVYKRETKALNKYLKYLSKINHGCVREILMEHKHKVKLNLTEMNGTGIMKFPVA
ncbi:MAG: hypothetical protein ABGW91_01895 [Christiangramia sp.]